MSKTFTHKLKVRFFDVDAMGHVNNAAFFTYLEEARTDFLMHLFDLKSLRETNFILIEQKLRYRKELHYRDEVAIEVYVKSLGNSSFVLGYNMRKSQELVAEGETVMLMFDYKKKQKLPLEGKIRQALEPYLC